MSRLIYLQKVALRLLGLEMTQVVGEEPGIMRPGVASDAWQACSCHISPCNRLFSTSFLILSPSPRPSQGSISQYLSVSGSGTAVLASARRALDESSNCLFLLPRSLSEGDQENNMLITPKLSIMLCCTVYISSSSPYLMGLKFILTVNTNGDIG